LWVRFVTKGFNEGKTDLSAQQAPPEADARVSRTDEHEERPKSAQAPARQGPEPSDRQQRIVSVNTARVPSADRRATHAFRPAQRIRRRAEFEQVYSRGVRIRGRYGTFFILGNTGRAGRLGIAATKKLGGAVQRNRAKRLIREVFRRNMVASGLDVVVVPKRELLDASLSVLEAEYRHIIERRYTPR
jgi:ribonuclease P protein component